MITSRITLPIIARNESTHWRMMWAWSNGENIFPSNSVITCLRGMTRKFVELFASNICLRALVNNDGRAQICSLKFRFAFSYNLNLLNIWTLKMRCTPISHRCVDIRLFAEPKLHSNPRGILGDCSSTPLSENIHTHSPHAYPRLLSQGIMFGSFHQCFIFHQALPAFNGDDFCCRQWDTLTVAQSANK